VFELWDTRNARLVGTFESESAALDAAYRELRAEAGPDDPAPVERPYLAVSPARSGSAPPEARRWARLPSALRGLSLWFV
jgi:hypothetical protein